MPHFQKEKKGNSGKTRDERKKPAKEDKNENFTAEDLAVGDVIECTQIPGPGEKAIKFSATLRRILPKKKKPFVFECSDGKVRQTALNGLDIEWKLQTEDDRRALAAVEALRWTGERSDLAVSQMKSRNSGEDGDDLAGGEAGLEGVLAGLGSQITGVGGQASSVGPGVDETPWVWENEAEEGDHADAWDPETANWADLWSVLRAKGWRTNDHYRGLVMTRELDGEAPSDESECAWASAAYVRVKGWTQVQPPSSDNSSSSCSTDGGSSSSEKSSSSRSGSSSGSSSRSGGGIACFLMPRPELGEPRAFRSEADVRLFLRSFPELLSEDGASSQQQQQRGGKGVVDELAGGDGEEEDVPQKPKSKAAIRRAKAARAQAKGEKKRKGQRTSDKAGASSSIGSSGEQVEGSTEDIDEKNKEGSEMNRHDNEEDDDSPHEEDEDDIRVVRWVKDEDDEASESGSEDGSGVSGSDYDDIEEEDSDEDDDRKWEDIDLSQSLFDSSKHASPADALGYMVKKYGFFLPEAEFISDLDGLLEYLHQKVRWGRCCLYCTRLFRDASSCQRHMIDVSHCKVAYATEEEISEVVDFYDFTEIYGTKDGFAPPDTVAAESTGAASTAAAVDSETSASATPAAIYTEEIPSVESLLEGLEVEEGESHRKDTGEEGSATSSSGSNTNNNTSEGLEEPSDAATPRRFLGRPGLHNVTVANPQGAGGGGDLLIKDAVSGHTKSIGHRSQRRYYQQHFPAADKRDSVLAAQREKLLIMYKQAGIETTSEEVAAEVAAMHQAKSLGRTIGQSRALSRRGQLIQRFTELREERQLQKQAYAGFAFGKGTNKALAGQFACKQDAADSAARRAIVHHWGAGGGGSHYNMAAAKSAQKGTQKGLLSRHSKQGARLQAQRNQVRARDVAKGQMGVRNNAQKGGGGSGGGGSGGFGGKKSGGRKGQGNKGGE